MLNFINFFGMRLAVIWFQLFKFSFPILLCLLLGGKLILFLFPKIDNPLLISNFKPISICNVCFKVISKILANWLKVCLPLLISKEQARFVSGRCPFDNIIALQEVTYSLEKDINDPPRMLVKIDIKKAYDTISLAAILATLTKMNFPTKWISWIEACLSSTSLSIMINDIPSPWIKPYKGIRQGDLIFSYHFILVSQNLSSMLNSALRQNMIDGFNQHLRLNFNHLMYLDDLILVSQASRRVASNIKLCLNIYGNLTGQIPNSSKLSIYFPSWFNTRVSKSICSILAFPISNFSITYLGIMVSPKRLAVVVFNNMIAKIRNLYSRWKNLHLSNFAKVVLINSSLLSMLFQPITYQFISSMIQPSMKSTNSLEASFGTKVGIEISSTLLLGMT